MDHLDEFEPPPSEDLEDDEIAVSRAFKRLKDEVLKLPPFEQRKLFSAPAQLALPPQRRSAAAHRPGACLSHCQGKAVRHGT